MFYRPIAPGVRKTALFGGPFYGAATIGPTGSADQAGHVAAALRAAGATPVEANRFARIASEAAWIAGRLLGKGKRGRSSIKDLTITTSLRSDLCLISIDAIICAVTLVSKSKHVLEGLEADLAVQNRTESVQNRTDEDATENEPPDVDG
jgi:hypothetical protein